MNSEIGMRNAEKKRSWEDEKMGRCFEFGSGNAEVRNKRRAHGAKPTAHGQDKGWGKDRR